MPAPIALQLYTVRDAIAASDYETVVRQVADIGYVGVEPAGFPGTTAVAAAALFRELDLAVPSAHSPLPLGDKKNEVLDNMAALGCQRLICPYLDPQTHYSSADQIQQTVALIHEAQAVAAEHGLTLGLHNHWFEFDQHDGRSGYTAWRDDVDPAVLIELDVYWAQTAGSDPAANVRELGARAALLHIKDGPATREAPMVAVGQGSLDIAGIIAAGAPHTEWLIVELDRCATDMITAVGDSYRYLVEGGLARGRS